MNNSNKNSLWFIDFKKSLEYQAFQENPVAYFCAEYALESTLPTYAGGLGVLAGDFVREAALQDFPLMSVGLRYKKAQNGLSFEENKGNNIKVVTDKNNREIIVAFPIEDRIVSMKAYVWEEGKTKVYLLDTDIEDNDPRDREITKCLYDENRDIRLKQEIVLGIGGFRVLSRLGYHSSVYHLNEGHSAFLALELVRHEMEHQNVNFESACEYAKKHVLFTNHTLVLAGQEQFSSEKVKTFMEKYAREMGLTGEDITRLGTLESDPSTFSMTILSFRFSTKSNAVSKLHMEKAEKIWPNQTIDFVTNGIFINKWDKIKGEKKGDILEVHLQNKKKLLDFVKEKSGEVWGEKDLIFVWARRLVEYKQPLLLFHDIDKLVEILKNSPLKVRIIFSGPGGDIGNEFIVKIKKIIEEKLKGVALFIPNYNIAIAEILTAGADIWLNTPMVGTEACGTSGMKAGLNGALSLSTNDGWIYEVKQEDIGWIINEGTPGEEILSLIENKIIPLFYSEHLKDHDSSSLGDRMQKVRNLILEDFSTTRALREYIEKLYIPILKQKHSHKNDFMIQ